MSTANEIRSMLRQNRDKFDWAHKCGNDAKKERLKRQRRLLESLLAFESERGR